MGVLPQDRTFVEVTVVPSAEQLEKLSRRKVLRMLLDEEAIDDKVAAKLLSWHHPGVGGLVGHEISAAASSAPAPCKTW